MFNEWAILELMGHRKIAGKITEESIAGQAFVRIDIYSADDKIELTQYYNPTSVYSLTPVEKKTAVDFSIRHVPVPIYKWELLPDIQEEMEEQEDE